MQARYERVSAEHESSYSFRTFRWSSYPFNWHFHPEVELTLIVRGYGQRFVGDDIAAFEVGDLVLLGSNLPHTWATGADFPRGASRCRSIVTQFLPGFLGDRFLATPEMAAVAKLLARAERGLLFGKEAQRRATRVVESMVGATPSRRLLLLLDALLTLAEDRRARPLCSAGFRPAATEGGQNRIGRVCAFLNAEYTRPIKLEEAADVSHLSISAFARAFRAATGKRFGDYLNELRVGRACDLLIRTDRKIVAVATDAGFGNLSNFNRRFLAVKGMPPREYRRAHQGSSQE